MCDTETRRFNEEAAKLGEGIEIWTLSMDLPFAQKRWCGAAGVEQVKTLSDFRDHAFAEGYGVLIADGPLAGVTARAVFVVGKDGTLKHVEYVSEIANEPDYDAALNAAKAAFIEMSPRRPFRLRRGRRACPSFLIGPTLYNTSNNPATPIPPPTHMVTTTFLAPRRLPSRKMCPT